MQWLSEAFRRARMLFSRRERFDHDMEEEMRLHRDLRAREIQMRGTPAQEADYAAQRRFGNTLRLREEIHQDWGFVWIDQLRQDLRYGLRLLRKSPVFTFVVVITLGLGIGANTAIFSVVNAVLLRPLPYSHPEQLLNVFENNLEKGIKAGGCSWQDFQELQQSGIFQSAAGAQRHDLTLTGVGAPAVVTTVVVTPEIFPLLNASPLAGRYFLPGDNQPGSAPVVLLSEGVWRSTFGADQKIVGSLIHLDQQAFTVVGIMPAAFRVPVFGSHQEIWIPVAHDPLFGGWMDKPGVHFLRVMARLKPGVALSQAQSEADSISRKLASDFPVENGGWAVRLAPLHAAIVGDMKTPLVVLLGAVGLVLLLACVNIANLLLARATLRAREMALRQAFGAERGRIIRQLLTESLMPGLLGGILGILLACLSTRALRLLLPADIPSTQSVQVDVWVLAFALLISMIASIGFGLAPALLAAKSGFQANFRDGAAASGSDVRRLRLRNFFTVAEIALAMVLVAAAGLLVRSLIRMTAVDPGFRSAHLLKAEISLPRYQYSTPQQWSAFAETLLDRIHAQPGLQESALAVPLPLADSFVNLPFSIPGHATPATAPPTADYVSVTPEYFHVMEIPLLRGRFFTREDSSSSHRVAIISESLARLHFREENPLGKKIVFGFPPDSNVAREIVGVVGNVRDAGLTQEPGPMMYVPFAQGPFWGGELVVKSTLAPSAVIDSVREVVRGIDQNLPVTRVAAMPDILDASVDQPRFRTWLLGGFGMVALVLAAIGVFGVVSYSVASRTREFGIRASLGASRGVLGRMIMLEGLGLALIGLGIGLASALALAHFLKSELYGIASYDPVTFLASTTILLAMVLAACYLPARRAMHADPMLALRYE